MNLHDRRPRGFTGEKDRSFSALADSPDYLRNFRLRDSGATLSRSCPLATPMG